MTSTPIDEAGLLHQPLLTLLAAGTHQATASDAAGILSQAGALVALLGFDDERAGLAGSAYAQLVLAEHEPTGQSAASAADRERAEMTTACRDEFLARGLCLLARPVGRGGLLTALATACGAGRPDGKSAGAAIVLPAPRAVGTSPAPSVAAQLFHEAPGRILVVVPAARYADAMLLAASHGVPFLPLGRSGGRELVVRASDGGGGFGEVVRISVAELSAATAALAPTTVG